MNIEILQDHIKTFNAEVVESGFKRDLDDYAASLPASENNIVALRGIADKVLSVLDPMYGSDLPENLKRLLPKQEIPPFTHSAHDSNLRQLIENTEIPQPQFFSTLTKLINQLRTQIDQNINEVNKVKEFIAPYISEDVERIAKDNFAIVAIVFNELRTITNLKEFSKTLGVWNRDLPIYHQLLKSESPTDIQIVEVQNGSIEIILNLNVDVALDLAELFKLGFETFLAYILYKKLNKPVVDSFHGNEELIAIEEKKERLLRGNIGAAIQKRIKEQHNKAKASDKKINKTSIDKKVEQVTKLITSHIIKGNDMKILALPTREDATDGEEVVPDERDTLRKQSMAARREFRFLPGDAQQNLLEAYGTSIEDEEE